MTVTLPVRIGLIGAGGIANAHLKGYAAIPDRVKVTAVADANPEAVAARVEETGATGYTDFLELVKDPNVDAVDICLPHHLHRDAIVAAAEAGKHILCEKPLCLTEQEAKDRSEEHTSELQSRENLVCRLLLEKKKNDKTSNA